MRRQKAQLQRMLGRGTPFAVATLVAAEQGGPRRPGACLFVSAEGTFFLGSLGAGCLDAEVLELALACLKGGGVQEARFSLRGDGLFAPGLGCGGWVRLRVEPWFSFQSGAGAREAGRAYEDWVLQGSPGVLLSRGSTHLALSPEGASFGEAQAFDECERQCALATLALGLEAQELESARGAFFVRPVSPPARLILVGAVDLADCLVPLATLADYRVLVVDPRRHYVNPERFLHPPETLVQAWPGAWIPSLALGPKDAGVVLTHDDKIDDAGLLALLETQVGYIGALGGSEHQARRKERLAAQGVSAQDLERIEGPAGLQLGGREPLVIAHGILAGVLRWEQSRRVLKP